MATMGVAFGQIIVLKLNGSIFKYSAVTHRASCEQITDCMMVWRYKFLAHTDRSYGEFKVLRLVLKSSNRVN